MNLRLLIFIALASSATTYSIYRLLVNEIESQEAIYKIEQEKLWFIANHNPTKHHCAMAYELDYSRKIK